jgi:hypothetical protein
MSARHVCKKPSLLLFLIWQSTAYAEPSGCFAAYKDNVANVVTSERESAQNSAYYEHYCGSDGSVDKSTLGVNLGATIQEIPYTFALNHGTDDEKMSSFCQTGKNTNGFKSQSSDFSRTIVLGAQQNLNSCLLLDKSNITIAYTYTPSRLVTITGNYSPPLINGSYPEAFLNRLIYDPTRITCSSNSFHNPSMFGGKNIDKTAKPQKINGAFSIECERIPDKKKVNGEDYYPDVQISTSIVGGGMAVSAPFTISVPAVENYGPTLSTDYQAKLELLRKQIADADLAKAQALQNAALLQGQLAAAQAQLASAHVTRTAAVVRSDQDIPGDVLTRIGCSDSAEAWAGRWCPADTTEHHVEATGSVGGGACGFSVYAVSCLKK